MEGNGIKWAPKQNELQLQFAIEKLLLLSLLQVDLRRVAGQVIVSYAKRWRNRRRRDVKLMIIIILIMITDNVEASLIKWVAEATARLLEEESGVSWVKWARVAASLPIYKVYTHTNTRTRTYINLLMRISAATTNAFNELLYHEQRTLSLHLAINGTSYLANGFESVRKRATRMLFAL